MIYNLYDILNDSYYLFFFNYLRYEFILEIYLEKNLYDSIDQGRFSFNHIIFSD